MHPQFRQALAQIRVVAQDAVEFDPVDMPQNPAPGALVAELVHPALEHVLAVGTEVVENAQLAYIRL